MKKTAVVWASQTGNTKEAAELIAGEIGREQVDLFEVSREVALQLPEYEMVIAGTSTWGMGELSYGWREAFPALGDLDFASTTVALFGLGDQRVYGDWYVDAMGILYDRFVARGATMVGAWPNSGYEFSSSKAFRDGMFVGLALDADNQHHLTKERIRRWVCSIRPHLD
ncbi:MAG: flavodoxin [Chlorobiaceae bacterium]|nr:flavodoxin [Chlorobiaceae bacterium]